MQPDQKNAQYDAMAATWKKMRDCSIGLRAVRARGSTYLPRLGGQDSDADASYQSYLNRAQFFNAVGRTVDSMGGHIFRKQPVITLPKAMDEYKNDINMGGLSLEGFLNNIVEEVVEVGRAGVLVEHPEREDDADGVKLTVEESRQRGLRPYLTSYAAEDIINWSTGRVNNATVLTRVFLSEKYTQDDEELIQIRELFLDGAYGQRVWRQSTEKNKKGGWFVFSEVFPKKNGAEIGEIPFYPIGTKEAGMEIQDPPLEGLADTCLGFYRNSADYENALHVAGTPTPWINGITNPEEFPAIHLGSNTFLKLPPEAEAGFLQTGADGVAALKEAMQEKKQEMAAQGARMLEADKRAVESAESQAIKRGGENSILASLAGSVEMSMTKALRFMAEWIGATDADKVNVELNKDYMPNVLDASTMKEYRENYLTGAWSFQTFFDACIAGEAVSEGLTYEDEIDRKENDPPALGLINDD